MRPSTAIHHCFARAPTLLSSPPTFRGVTQQQYVEWLVAGTPLPKDDSATTTTTTSSSNDDAANPAAASGAAGSSKGGARGARESGASREAEAWAITQRCLDAYTQRCSAKSSPVDAIYADLLDQGGKVVRTYMTRD